MNTKKRAREDDNAPLQGEKQAKRQEAEVPVSSCWSKYTLEHIDELLDEHAKAFQPTDNKEEKNRLWDERVLNYMRKTIMTAIDETAEIAPHMAKRAWTSIASGVIVDIPMVGFQTWYKQQHPKDEDGGHTGLAGPIEKHWKLIQDEMAQFDLVLEWRRQDYDPDECCGWFWRFSVYSKQWKARLLAKQKVEEKEAKNQEAERIELENAKTTTVTVTADADEHDNDGYLFTYVNSMNRKYDNQTKNIHSVVFELSGCVERTHTVKFDTPVTELYAVQAVERYLSEPMDKAYFDSLEEVFTQNYDWEEEKARFMCRGDALKGAQFIEDLQLDTEGQLSFMIGV
jgi:hypothetical protein